MKPCVVLTPDANFELPLGVALASLSAQHPDVGCRVIVLHDGVPDSMQRRVEAEVRGPSTIEWCAVDDDLLGGCAPPQHLPRASLYTLLVAVLLPRDIDRAIYLDVDVVVDMPLLELWKTPLGENPIGAVRGAHMPWMAAVDRFPWRRLGLAPATPYFNNGVMLMDVDRWRRENILDRAVALIRDYELPYGEQDALNVLFADGWHRLHPRWNLQAGHFVDPCLAWVVENSAELDDARSHPAVIHYNGPTKPWHADCEHPLAAKWLEWIDRTQYRGWRPHQLGSVSQAAVRARAALPLNAAFAITGTVHGFWNDRWVAADLRWSAVAAAAVSELRIAGIVPDVILGGQDLTLQIGSRSWSCTFPPGPFEWLVPVTLDKGKGGTTAFRISASRSYRPKSFGLSSDERHLAWIVVAVEGR